MISPFVPPRTAIAVPSTLDGASLELRTKGHLYCVVVESEAEFLDLGPLWEELAERATNRSPALAWSWLRSWWEVVGSVCPKTGRTGMPYVVLLYDELTPVAAYPFVFGRPTPGSFALRRLRPMGHSGELEPSALTEEAFSLVATGYEERARERVVGLLAERLAEGQWDCAITRQINFDEEFRPLRRPSRAVIATKSKGGPQVVRVPGEWGEFRRRLSKSMRDNLSYYPRLLRRAGHAFTVQIYREPEAIDEAIEMLVGLHRDRVYSDVGHRHQDYFSDPWQRSMMETGMRRLGPEEKGFLATLEIDGKPIAAQCFLQRETELMAHYSGFDPSYARFSPLLVLQAEVFRMAIEQMGIRKLNLLFGASPWQKRWGSALEGQEARVLLLSLRPTALARAALYVIGRESSAYARRSGLRRWFRRITYRSTRTV